MTANYPRRRRRADRQIRKYGFRAVLRRTSGDRDCWLCRVDDMPSEDQGQMARDTGRIYLITPIGLTLPPDAEEDELVLSDRSEKIMAPVGKLDPGDYVIYYEIRTEGGG